MAKGKKEGIEQVVENVQPPEGEPAPQPEVQPKSPTLEELQASVAEATKRQEELQAEIERKEAVIQRLQKRKSEPTTFQPSSQTPDTIFLKTYIDDRERRARELGEVDPDIPMLRGELARREQAAYMALQQQQWATHVEQERQALEDKLTEAGLSLDDDRLEEVRDAFEDAAEVTGKFDRAHRKLEKVLKTIKPKEEKTVKKGVKLEDLSDEEREEIKRQIMEKEGLLKSDKSLPSGGGEPIFKAADIPKLLDPSKMTPAEISAKLAELERAAKEGRIK